MNPTHALLSRIPASRLPSVAAAVLILGIPHADAAVSVERLPEAGLQPQAIAAPDGTVHLLYLTGEPKSSDIRYRRQASGGAWSASLRVNSQSGSAVALGTIRGPQMALGRDGRVHVVWNGAPSAGPKPGGGGSPMLYARLANNGRSFSAQRNLMTISHGLDGGGSVAADSEGRVYVAWHAAPAGQSGETNRLVFLSLSTDDGETFAPERAVSPAGLGACACCGLTASVNACGDAFVLFRTARTLMQRDMALLVSSDHGTSFRQSFAHPWVAGTCPMSSATVHTTGELHLAAWETAGRVYIGRFPAPDSKPDVRAVGPLSGAKHPRLATNARGETLMVWTEGTGWQRGGALAWLVCDADGKPTDEQGRRDGVPIWSYATAYAQADGRFVILY